MIKKNIVFIAQSLDGFIAGKNGELDWLHATPNPDNVGMGFFTLMDEIDAIIMGRTTYETVLGFSGEWPYKKHVFVLSNSIKEIPAELQSKATILNGTSREILDKIHKLGHYTLYIDGGRTVQNFLRDDLVDELRITTIPILLGGGFPLFGDLEESMNFEHIKTEVFLGQLVQSQFVRKR